MVRTTLRRRPRTRSRSKLRLRSRVKKVSRKRSRMKMTRKRKSRRSRRRIHRGGAEKRKKGSELKELTEEKRYELLIQLVNEYQPESVSIHMLKMVMGGGYEFTTLEDIGELPNHVFHILNSDTSFKSYITSSGGNADELFANLRTELNELIKNETFIRHYGIQRDEQLSKFKKLGHPVPTGNDPQISNQPVSSRRRLANTVDPLRVPSLDTDVEGVASAVAGMNPGQPLNPAE